MAFPRYVAPDSIYLPSSPQATNTALHAQQLTSGPSHRQKKRPADNRLGSPTGLIFVGCCVLQPRSLRLQQPPHTFANFHGSPPLQWADFPDRRLGTTTSGRATPSAVANGHARISTASAVYRPIRGRSAFRRKQPRPNFFEADAGAGLTYTRSLAFKMQAGQVFFSPSNCRLCTRGVIGRTRLVRIKHHTISPGIAIGKSPFPALSAALKRLVTLCGAVRC